ncbi:DIS3-like exonuclease 2 [Ostrinia furnacalis]|uniref:DIS3-like exonuclease 2 n=1 Tax=Ostrinia furnacalis TaxID=93504 RepID=UPI00103EE32B|nr:DIS3-like exonuclease 2 [Ostrinia furnacalis]XP_028170177.1 DIS3-like exonuclease 2 [Ostrinia furnacalis]
MDESTSSGNAVEGNIDTPSTSSTSQPLRSKCSVNNKKKENNASPSKKSPKKSTNSKQKQDANSRQNSTTSVEDITNHCENINISSGTEAVALTAVQVDKPASPRKKSAKKKERLKRLQIPGTSDSGQAQTQMTPNTQANGMIPIQELFARYANAQIGASSSSSYLQNMTHHPHFQYMHNVQVGEMFQNLQSPVSAPNTPLVYMTNRANHRGFPSPVMLSEPNTPKFLQNALHHPLLNLSKKDRLNQSGHKYPNVVSDKVNSKKKQKSEENIEDRKFEPYISAEEVEEGLKNNTLIEGVLRINPKQFQHSYLSSNDRSEQDILIDGLKNRNRALEADVVVVKLIEDTTENENGGDNKQKKGKIVYIKEKVHNRTCIGNLKLMADKNRQKALFIPRDHRIPRLNIPFTSWPDNFYQDFKRYENTLFLAKIQDWYDTRFAVGVIVCNIGQSGDMISETKAILAQSDLDITPFGPEVRHLYPRLDYTIPAEEILIREDCRRLCIFSIDPPNCRDIDDAVSCRELENGNYEIGVHISDVTHFLTENTLLDEKVAEKATTIYMVERAYHMLPDDLCMLCSLLPGVDKLAFSVFWEINDNAEVLTHRFAKTVIHSCSQLAYDHAQAILEDRDDAESIFPETYNGYQFKDVYKSIKTLGKIAAVFRNRRFEGGALKIDQPKVSFRLNPENGMPESFCLYENKESHQLIEEFMLLANMTVANRIHEDHPDLAFLRCHPPPSGFMLRQLANALQPMGIKLKISSAGALHKSLLKHASEDRGKAMVLNMLCAKPMARAKYFCAHGCDDDDFLHYALNVPLYTHFTSPIRRYADIMVHRLLAASIKFRDTPEWEVDKVRMVAAQCNKQKYNAKKAGELSTELYTLKYIELHSPLVIDAVVVEVRERYIDTILIAMGLNRRIFFNSDFPGEYKCIKNDAGAKLSKMELTWKISDDLPEIKQTIEVFSILKVELIKGDDNTMVKVETKLARPQ